MKDSKINAPVVQTLSEYMPAPLVDETTESGDDVKYYGYAPLGTEESEEGWRIAKVVTEGTVTKTLYAQGSMDYRFAWSERANYTYSR